MALKLYMNTIRVVLDVDQANENSWSRIYGSLCCLRQSLLCTSCQKLLTVPQRPIESDCEHSYCSKCIEARKPQCESCNKNPEFEEHTRLRIILQCYKKMCRYIMSSDICRCWDKTKLSSPIVRFISMVYEGADLEDRYHHICNPVSGPLVKKTKTSDTATETSTSVNVPSQICTLKTDKNKPINIKLPRVIKKSVLADRMLTVYAIPDPSSDDSEIDCPKVIAKCLRSVKKKRSCQCGMTSQHRGNLTCCGQRCPCYVNGRACINCRCKGCRNPQKNLISSPPYHSDHHHDHKMLEESLAVNVQSCSYDKESYVDSEKDSSD